MFSGDLTIAVLILVPLIALIIPAWWLAFSASGLKPILREIRDDQRLLLLEVRRSASQADRPRPGIEVSSRPRGLRAERP